MNQFMKVIKLFIVFIFLLGFLPTLQQTNAQTLMYDEQLRKRVASIINKAETIDESEKKIRSAYQTALKKKKIAEANLNSARDRNPVYVVYGEILFYEPFTIWGVAGASGYAPYQGNIRILNPDEGTINYGLYVQGFHYYVDTITGTNNYGQSVPIEVYGGKPSTLTKLENQAQAANKKVENESQKLISYVITKYNKRISTYPNDQTLHIQKAIALFNLALYLEDPSLTTKANEASYKTKDRIIGGIYLLYINDVSPISSDVKADTYQVVAEYAPELVYNYPTTTMQYYYAGLAFSKSEEYMEAAIFCLQKAKTSGNANIVQSATKLLQKLTGE